MCLDRPGWEWGRAAAVEHRRMPRNKKRRPGTIGLRHSVGAIMKRGEKKILINERWYAALGRTVWALVVLWTGRPEGFALPPLKNSL